MQPKKKILAWLLETIILPMLPVLFAFTFRQITTRPTIELHNEPLLWSSELPFATLFICVNSIYRLERLPEPNKLIGELLFACKGAAWFLALVSVGFLFFFYMDKERIWKEALATNTRDKAISAQIIAAVIALLGAIILETYERMTSSSASKPVV